MIMRAQSVVAKCTLFDSRVLRQRGLSFLGWAYVWKKEKEKKD